MFGGCGDKIRSNDCEADASLLTLYAKCHDVLADMASRGHGCERAQPRGTRPKIEIRDIARLYFERRNARRVEPASHGREVGRGDV